MENWFTAEKLDRDTFAISEYQHWEETHCYLLCGSKKALLIDTGLGVSNLREVVESLTPLPVFVATTHVHWDHIGGHRLFARFAVHEAEVAWISKKFPLPLEAVKRNLTCRPCAFPSSFRLDRYQIFQGTPQKILHDGDRLDLGGRVLEVIHTPGHSPGHCCFYEPERETLYAGDLLYDGALDAFYPTTDPWLFWKSVQKVQKLPVSRILPGHHKLRIPAARIGEVERAFHSLFDAGKLKQGAGLFDFGAFQIHL